MTPTYDQLHAAVRGDAVGVRVRIEFEPLGGHGDKVFPPTYSVADRGPTKYAVEPPIEASGGATSQRVVLDSVASQANRLELALLDAIRTGTLAAPITSVDFADHGLFGLGRISDYEAPHRIFDALLRDSLDGEDLFRHGTVGRAVTDASSRNASAIFHHSPHTLVFGGWDSTGPRGGRGAKYERAITSEIVAHDVERGVKTTSRIDPAGIEKDAGTVYEASGPLGWTLEASEATPDKGKPKLYSRGGSGDAGRPSQINHGNIAPSIDATAGGVIAQRIVATTVLSFVQLRRLRFPTDVDGQRITDSAAPDAEAAARTALAALGLAATALAVQQGFDLRSRCVLVPRESPTYELVGRTGDAQTFELDAAAALALVAEAAERSAANGLGWRQGELVLQPSDRLIALIRRSQDAALAGEVEA